MTNNGHSDDTAAMADELADLYDRLRDSRAAADAAEQRLADLYAHGDPERLRAERDTLARAVIGEQDYLWSAAHGGADGVPGYDTPDDEYEAALANAAEMHRLLELRADRLADTTSNEATTDA